MGCVKSKDNIWLYTLPVHQRVEVAEGAGSPKRGFVVRVKQDDKTGGKPVYRVVLDDYLHGKFGPESVSPIDLDAEGFLQAADLGFMAPVKEWVKAGTKDNKSNAGGGGGHGPDDDMVSEVSSLNVGYNDINVTDGNGQTALHRAADNLDIVNYLVMHGASMSLRDRHGYTPIDSALKTCKFEVVRYLMSTRARLVWYTYSPEAAIVQHFARCMRAAVPSVCFENVLLLPKAEFISGNGFKTYKYTQKSLVRACDIPLEARVLFICHRRTIESEKSPGKRSKKSKGGSTPTVGDAGQFATAVRFLTTIGQPCDYVWVDYSCLPEDPSDPRYQALVENIPTAIVLSSYTLVLPSLCQIMTQAEQSELLPAALVQADISNLSEFLGRGWCMVEVLASILFGNQMYCHLHIGGFRSEFARVESWSAFEEAAETTYKGVQKELNEASQQGNLWPGVVQRCWVGRSIENLMCNAVLAIGSITAKGGDEGLARRMVTSSLTWSDVQRDRSLQGLAHEIGLMHKEDDRLLLLKMMLVLLCYCMDKLPEISDDNTEPISESTTGTTNIADKGGAGGVVPGIPVAASQVPVAPAQESPGGKSDYTGFTEGTEANDGAPSEYTNRDSSSEYAGTEYTESQYNGSQYAGESNADESRAESEYTADESTVRDTGSSSVPGSSRGSTYATSEGTGDWGEDSGCETDGS